MALAEYAASSSDRCLVNGRLPEKFTATPTGSW
jgi:hypothetical protein